MLVLRWYQLARRPQVALIFYRALSHVTLARRCAFLFGLPQGIVVLGLSPVAGSVGSNAMGGSMARDDVMHAVMAVSMLLLGKGAAGLGGCSQGD